MSQLLIYRFVVPAKEILFVFFLAVVSLQKEFSFQGCLLRCKGALSEHNYDGPDDFIWKCYFMFMQSFLDCSRWFGLRNPVLELNRFSGKETRGKKCWMFVVKASLMFQKNGKIGHFRSWKGREQLRNAQKWKRTYKWCKTTISYVSLLNMQIFGAPGAVCRGGNF